MRHAKGRSADGVPRIGNTLDEYVRAYLSERDRLGVWRPQTLKNYESILMRFSLVHGRRPLNQLGQATILDWAEILKKEGQKGSTRNTARTAMRGFLGWLPAHAAYELAGQKRRVPDLRDFLPPRKKIVWMPAALEAEQAAAVLRAVPDVRAAAIVALELYGALRRVEVHRLKREDYDGSILQMRGKGADVVVVDGIEEAETTRANPAGRQIKLALERWLDERGRHPGPMFPGRDPDRGLSLNALSNIVSGVMKDAGCKTKGRGGHALRHTAATDALKMPGQNIRTVQVFMGHDSLATTAVYLKVNESELLACADRPDYRDGPTGEPPATAA